MKTLQKRVDTRSRPISFILRDFVTLLIDFSSQLYDLSPTFSWRFQKELYVVLQLMCLPVDHSRLIIFKKQFYPYTHQTLNSFYFHSYSESRFISQSEILTLCEHLVVDRDFKKISALAQRDYLALNMATLLVFNSSSKVAFGDLSQARPWNWCNLKSGRRIAARAQNPNNKRNQMSDNEKLRTCRGLGSFCAILQKPIGNSQSHRREKRWYNKNHRECPSKDQIEVTSLHSTKRKNLLVPTFRIQSFARKNVGMPNVSFWPLPNWHKTKT